MKIGKQVKEALRLAGLSQKDAAKKLGVSQPNISSFVTSDSITTSNLQKIADITGYTFTIEPGEAD